MNNFPDGTIKGSIPLSYPPQNHQKTLYQALIEAANSYGAGKTILEDTSGNPTTSTMSYCKLITFVNILSEKLSPHVQHGEKIGILMPNVNATIALFFALSRLGAVPAMLQFIVAPDAVLSACNTAEVKTVITAHSFLDKASEQGSKLPADIIEHLAENDINVLYIDTIAKKEVTIIDKAKAAFRAWRDLSGHYPQFSKFEDIATILFTSGSESAPKGVALSHQNIVSNHQQVCSRVKLDPNTDVVFNALPTFHCFGLLTATLLPLFSGIKIFMHSNPKDAAHIPGYIQKAKATITFGTNSFFSAYGAEVLKPNSPYPERTVFSSLRFALAGAEALKEETRKQWLDMFNVELMEGYGVTETAPVISVNVPGFHKPRSVGQFLSGTEYALVPVEGFDSGYELYIKGPHVMLGYIFADKPGKVIVPDDGWHNTGDVGRVDEDGYLYITGRLSRFIKVKGEKVPLSIAETIAKSIWPDAEHGVGKYTDANGRERMALFTTSAKANLKELEEAMVKQSIPLRHMVSQVKQIDELPLLGSGKLDLRGIDKLAAADFATV